MKYQESMIGRSPALTYALERLSNLARINRPILLMGERGTGKELAAQRLHFLSARWEAPLVKVNCAALADSLLESELFGHEAGAFTGAKGRHRGYLEQADGGTLFLDEIGEMEMDLQAKLLTAIEDQTLRRLGSEKVIKVDVQILAASNRNLKQLIAEHAFREDLYYRLKVVDLHIPALRERREDVPELVGFFIKENNPKMGKNILGVTPKALEKLKEYNWPGNIRELKNAVERAMLFCDDAEISVSHLSPDILNQSDR